MKYRVGDYFVGNNVRFWWNNSIGLITDISVNRYKIKWIKKSLNHIIEEHEWLGNPMLHNAFAWESIFIDKNSLLYKWWYEK